MGGLWEFAGGEKVKPASPEVCPTARFKKNGVDLQLIDTLEADYRLHARFFVCTRTQPRAAKTHTL